MPFRSVQVVVCVFALFGYGEVRKSLDTNIY